MAHQLDRIEEMLQRLTVHVQPDVDSPHVLKREVSKWTIDLFGFMLSDRKIEAIRAYRQLTGMGLKESKDAIESIMSRFGKVVL